MSDLFLVKNGEVISECNSIEHGMFIAQFHGLAHSWGRGCSLVDGVHIMTVNQLADRADEFEHNRKG